MNLARLGGLLCRAVILLVLAGCVDTHSRVSADSSEPVAARASVSPTPTPRPTEIPVSPTPTAVPTPMATPTPSPTPSPSPLPPTTAPTSTRPAIVPTQAAPRMVKVRIAEYNTQNGKSPRKVLENLRSVSPDLVVLEEVSRSNCRIYAEALGMTYQFGPYQPDVMFGLGILARGPIEPVKIFTMPNERNYGMASKVKVGDQEILLVCAHLKSLPRPLVTGLLKSMGPHKEQAQKILELVKKERLPAIVAGDFNTLSFTPEYLALSSAMKDTAAVLGTTSKPSILINGAGYRIDYIFYRGPWTPTAYKVSPLPGSDHFMVWADLELAVK